MVSKIRYLYKNLIDLDDTVLTESSEVSSLPVENLQHSLRTIPWRTGSLVDNPLLNAGFEEGAIGQQPPSWGKYSDGDGGSTFLTQSGGSEGSKEAQLIIGGTDTYVSGWQQYEFGSAMKEGQRYIAKAKFKAASSCSVKLQIKETVGGTNRYRNCDFTLPGGSEWVEKQIDIVIADGDNTRIQVSCMNITSGVTLKIDDVRLYRYESVIIDLGTAMAVKAFALINHNIQNGADIWLFGNSSDSWEGTAGENPGYGLPVGQQLTYKWDENIIIKHFANYNYRYWRFEVLDSSNPDEYLEFGRIYLGSYFEPTRNFVYGWEYGLVDPSEIDESEGGQEFVDVKEQYRVVRVAFTEGAPLSDADKENYEEMLRYVGRGKDLFISLDYENKPNKWSFYGKFANTSFNFREFNKGYFSTGFDFKESR